MDSTVIDSQVIDSRVFDPRDFILDPPRTAKCSRCNADALDIGFMVQTVSYCAHTRNAGKLVKSQKIRSEFETAHCLLCGESLAVNVKTLTA